MKNTIRQDEWQAALDAEMKGDEGETFAELAERLNMKPDFVYKWVKRMVKEGKAIEGTSKRAWSRGIRTVNVYQLVKGKK